MGHQHVAARTLGDVAFMLIGVPEAPALDDQRLDGVHRRLIATGLMADVVQQLVRVHVVVQVAAFRGADHLRRAFHDLAALRGRGPACGVGGYQMFQRAAGLNQIHVIRQLDHRYAQAAPGFLADQAGRHHAQQRFPQRRSPQTGFFNQICFHHRAARF
ncbi:hypothetical protein D3C71_1643100 [compost metagenome]